MRRPAPTRSSRRATPRYTTQLTATLGWGQGLLGWRDWTMRPTKRIGLISSDITWSRLPNQPRKHLLDVCCGWDDAPDYRRTETWLWRQLGRLRPRRRSSQQLVSRFSSSPWWPASPDCRRCRGRGQHRAGPSVLPRALLNHSQRLSVPASTTKPTDVPVEPPDGSETRAQQMFRPGRNSLVN